MSLECHLVPCPDMAARAVSSHCLTLPQERHRGRQPMEPRRSWEHPSHQKGGHQGGSEVALLLLRSPEPEQGPFRAEVRHPPQCLRGSRPGWGLSTCVGIILNVTSTGVTNTKSNPAAQTAVTLRCHISLAFDQAEPQRLTRLPVSHLRPRPRTAGTYPGAAPVPLSLQAPQWDTLMSQSLEHHTHAPAPSGPRWRHGRGVGGRRPGRRPGLTLSLARWLPALPGVLCHLPRPSPGALV